jgi:sporulation protein YlmC with PRC-barrel domain
MNRPHLDPESRNFLSSLIGKDVVDVDGGTVGHLERIYWRHEDGRPEWGIVSAGMIERRRIAVPLMAASFDENISVPYPRDLIDDTPELEQDAITPQNEMDLYRHYNIRREAAEGESASDKPVFFDTWPESSGPGQPQESVQTVAEPGPAASHEAIINRAYEIYLARGGTDGLDQEDWLKAEAELSTRK